MRKLIFLILVTTLAGWWGCGGDHEPEERTIGMANVMVIGVDPTGCHTADVCSQLITVQWTDNETGTKYYRLMLTGQSTSYETETIASSASGTLSEGFEVPYTSGLPPGEYQVDVYKVLNYQASYKQRLVAATSANTAILYEFSADCSIDCCSDGYFYAGAYKGNDNTDLVKATIDTPFPRLCSESTGSEGIAHSNVNVGLLHQASCATGDSLYAETGFLRWSKPDPYEDFWGWYAVMAVPGAEPTNYTAYPDPVVASPNEPHEYEVYLDVSTGTLHFSCDNNEIYSESNQAWENQPCDQAVWLGEIRGRETDMARMPDGDKCWFSQCKYRDGLGWHDLDLKNDLLVVFRSDDDTEWKVERGVDSNSFSIQDLKVIPWPPQ